MAIFTYGATAGQPGIDMFEPHFPKPELAISSIQTSSAYTLTYDSDSSDEFAGTGLTYGDDGALTGGIVTRWTHIEEGQIRWQITGLSLPATTLDYDVWTHLVIEMLLGNDTVQGTSGDDNLSGGEGNDTVSGNAGHDYLEGGWGNDTLSGGGGNDVLDAGPGTDTLKGGSGDDTYMVNVVQVGNVGKLEDSFSELANEGVDTLKLQSDWLSPLTATVTLAANFENLDATNVGGVGVKLNLIGNALGNEIHGAYGVNVIDGGAGNDKLYGDNGEHDDTLIGGAGDDELHGGVWVTNDTLIGGAGADKLYGGDGNDLYKMDQSDTVIEETGYGIDTVEMTVSLKNSTFDLLLSPDFWNIEIFKLIGNIGATVIGDDNQNTIIGGAGADTLDGGLNDDILNGGGGADVLRGGWGIDTYYLDNVNDIVEEENDGEADDSDTVVANYLISKFITGVENYTYTGTAAWTFTGNDEGNVLTGGSGADVLKGGAGYDELFGGAGADVLDGGDLHDLLVGGLGNDIYYRGEDGIYDQIIELANEGIDTVYTWFSTNLTDPDWQNIENVKVLAGAEVAELHGNAASNVLDASASATRVYLEGAGGNDILTGSAFDDELRGQEGIDILKGGKGNDIYLAEAVQVGTGSTAKLVDTITELAGEGTDTLYIEELAPLDLDKTFTFSLGANLENLYFASAIVQLNVIANAEANEITANMRDNVLDGGAGNDVLYGDYGNDTLIGGLGNDELYGGGQNDILIGGLGADKLVGGEGDDVFRADDKGDTIVEIDGEGEDTVEMTASVAGKSFDLAQYGAVEHFALMGSLASNVTGNDADNRITGNAAVNALTGGKGNDLLLGNAGNDVLDGGDGNDLFDGGAGIDKMSGGDGDDIYIVDNIGDKAIEVGVDGEDLVRASVTYILDANIEDLELTGKAAINATGNSLDNTLAGNEAANILDGMWGADTMVGGKGNDTYLVDDVDDSVVEVLNEGKDLVKSTLSYVLGANVENLILLGDKSAHIDGTGNELANSITGNDGNNRLDGSAGNDILTGGKGDDTYVVDSIGDKVVEALANATGGIDTVESSITFSLATLANVDHLTLTGSAHINGTGNTLANTIAGNDGNNTLDGGAGNDTLTGGKGDDTLVGGLGDDKLEGGEGADVLQGGAGNDHLHVVDLSIAQVDGGAGTDRLHFDLSGNIDLGDFDGNPSTTQLGKIVGIEVLDFDNGAANAVTLHLTDLLDMNVKNNNVDGVAILDNVLKIDGDNDDTLTLSAVDGWGASPDTTTLAGYAIYTAQNVKIAIDQDIDVTVA
jgi:Ca2+-binding RTX toxin-like protein